MQESTCRPAGAGRWGAGAAGRGVAGTHPGLGVPSLVLTEGRRQARAQG